MPSGCRRERPSSRRSPDLRRAILPVHVAAVGGGLVALEIRACKPEEMEQYYAVMSYVFADNDGYEAESTATSPDWTTCAIEDGRVLATMGTYPFTARLNGAPVAMGGVTAVGTLPAYRRRGFLRQIMTQGFGEMRDRKQPFAILWASMAAIYQRFGYALAASQVHYSFDPRQAGLAFPRVTPGSITFGKAEDLYDTLKPLYVEYATPRNLMLHRARPLWQLDTLRPAKKGEPVYAAVYHDGDGAPRGYVVYQTHDGALPRPGPGQVMTVKEFVALDLDAWVALWEYIRRHDLVGRVDMRNVVSEDDPAPDLLMEPRMLNRSTSDAIWLRIVDIAEGLPKRPYGARGELTFRVDDPLCPWNSGTWLIETDGPSADIRQVSRQPELELTINALGTLVSGRATATHLARSGTVSAASDAVLKRADALFRTEYAPHCPNNF
ncbi:MAG: enhanced intracellular survival protein Eis [Dehalococcoidia bacterium]